ncbi:hypothetical protein EDC22_101490 [Tepidamorphus gemmatus]|uniref:Lipoprotein n=1 Tax=Tepidamorphus gemmatus TaxID=747076 RepID=A0A4R3MMC1_9HYPH|nr:hypothetical protein [Tepidamorphus gemmatus]TCT13620.1 hypothetical protein EDC22_101490 [Tepidamorphus gemmatus]
MTRFLSIPRTLVALTLAMLLAVPLVGCQTDPATPPPPQSQQTTLPPPAATQPVTIAFEPIVGLPPSRATVLATELGIGAAEMTLPVVGRDSPDVRFRIKGYFSAAAAAGQTRISYVWDLFDADGRRVHRIAGSEVIPATLPDPWQAVADETLRTIARNTAMALRQWIDSGTPTSPVTAELDPPDHDVVTQLDPVQGTRAGLVETQAMATGGARRIYDPSALAGPGPSTGAAAAAIPAPPRFTYHIGAVAGATGDGSVALATALSAQLEAAGGARVAAAADANYLIAGEATVGPPTGGRQIVAIIWTVADRTGRTLGSVRQVAEFAQGTLDHSWGASADSAAASAAAGVLALMPAE